MKVWDTAGMERFKTLTYSFYKRANAILVAFSVVDRQSFENIQNWITAIKENASENIPIIIVGTKIDLEYERVITKEEGEQYAKTIGYKYVETSSFTDEGVQNCFSLIFEAAILAKYYEKLSLEQDNNVNANAPKISEQRAKIQALINKTDPVDGLTGRERGLSISRPSFSIKRDVIQRKKSLCNWLTGK